VEDHGDLIAKPATLDPLNWAAAQAAQEAAIAAGGGSEAYQGLAIALFWQNEGDHAQSRLGLPLADRQLRGIGDTAVTQ
jgi:hypothetical protein